MAEDAAITLFLWPALGFLAGFAAKWVLQERKSRDELARALATERAAALRRLWDITTIPADVTRLGDKAAVVEAVRERSNAAILAWYTAEGGALFLSWTATQHLFDLLDLLRAPAVQVADLDKAVSALRTRLKLDCGMTTPAESRRQLRRPRPSAWPPSGSDAPALPGEAGSAAQRGENGPASPV